MEEALTALLLASAGVGAIVGARVDWDVRPQADDLDALVLHEISAAATYTMRGRVPLMGRLTQIDAWSLSSKGAKTLRRAVIATLDGLNAAPTETLRAAFVESLHAGFDAGSDSLPDLYRASLDVRVWTPSA
jgi:hypothetical protein